MGYSPWDHKELDMTEVTEHACTHALIMFIISFCIPIPLTSLQF